jgi:tetratricopeptide (TPR) repeat protein
LFEIYTATSIPAVGFDIAVPLAEQQALAQHLTTAADVVLLSLLHVDLTNARAFLQADQYSIRDVIHETVGFGYLNVKVKELLRKWCLGTARTYFAALEPQETEEYAQLALNMAKMAQTFGDKDAAQDYIATALQLLEANKFNMDWQYEAQLLQAGLWIEDQAWDKAAAGYQHVYDALQAQEKDMARSLTFAKAMAGFGAVAFGRHALGEALQWHTKALELRKALLEGKQHLDLADSYTQLGRVHCQLGNHELGVAYLENTRLVCLSELGEKHPQVADCYHEMAELSMQFDEYFQAPSLLEMAIKLREEILGHAHPDTQASKQLLIEARALVEGKQGNSQARQQKTKAVGLEESKPETETSGCLKSKTCSLV